MKPGGFLLFWSVVTAVVAALSLGPSFAHVLESVPRLSRWSPELWREATVFNGQFRLFATVGAPLDLAAIVCPAVLAWMLHDDRPAFRYAAGATALFAAALIAWFALVKPMNDVLATWTPGPIPGNFDEVRSRWEAGHMAVCSMKAAGFTSLVLALLFMHRG